jgi:hypothetical protein
LAGFIFIFHVFAPNNNNYCLTGDDQQDLHNNQPDLHNNNDNNNSNITQQERNRTCLNPSGILGGWLSWELMMIVSLHHCGCFLLFTAVKK